MAKTLREEYPWIEDYMNSEQHRAVGNCPVDSAVGHDCATVLNVARALSDLLKADMPIDAEACRYHAFLQCTIYYHG